MNGKKNIELPNIVEVTGNPSYCFQAWYSKYKNIYIV